MDRCNKGSDDGRVNTSASIYTESQREIGGWIFEYNDKVRWTIVISP